MKNRLPVFAFLFLLPLGACMSGPNQATIAKAEKGDVKAMFHLAEYQCAREDAAAKGAETVKWWKKIAASKNAGAAAQANEYLGLYHLSLFANEDTYNPDAPEPISYCTGSPAKPAYTKAIRYFTRCADSGLATALSCQADLGHLYLHRKDYAKAYLWYATVLVEFMDETYGAGHGREISPLDPELATTLPAQNARRAAEHLSLEQAASLGKQAQEWVKAHSERQTE